MRLILTALLFVGGLFFVVTGADFLIRPEDAAAGFGMAATTKTGLAAIRGDMTAFFLITGLSMLIGAWRRNGDILLIPAFMLGCALLGRFITLLVNGADDGFFLPMIVEGVFVILSLLGSRILPHPVTDGDETT
ncbi:DUF4345 family protein [Pontixanthobacter luteolus]|uniref:DUF4345 family protein n=1 Tax=Pontixanthobacter luteolus TaxID=295089 RepID=UPI002304717C|nr:DUF4345 family protein [Pontixanthobacter luteolus]